MAFYSICTSGISAKIARATRVERPQKRLTERRGNSVLHHTFYEKGCQKFLELSKFLHTFLHILPQQRFT